MTSLQDIPLNTKPIPAPPEKQPTNTVQEDHDEVLKMWNGENFIRAEFTNNERTHVRVYYHRPADEGRGECDFIYDENHKFTKALLKLTDLDTMHELTYKRIKQEERYFKEFAVRVGREQGLLIDPVAYYDEETQSSKVDTKFYSYGLKLFFDSFDESTQKEDLFIVKLAAFELDLVKESDDREMKSKIRKAKNPIEILKILLEFKGS